jgi:hypothetical protein
MKKDLAVLLVILITACLAGFYFVFIFPQKLNALDAFLTISSKNQSAQKELTPEEIMEVIKTDKDYNDLSGFIKGFDPAIVDYIKLGPDEYKKMKLEWQKQGLGDRIGMVDKLTLTDSTYWIELKNKKDESKGLRMILDVKEKKSLLLIAALSIKAGIGL